MTIEDWQYALSAGGAALLLAGTVLLAVSVVDCIMAWRERRERDRKIETFLRDTRWNR